MSVEFEAPGSEEHPMAAKAVQNWTIEQDHTPEQWTLTVLNPSSFTYKLGMKSPKETTVWYSAEIPCNASANTLKYIIAGFFSAWSRAGSDITVSLTMYDVNGVITTNLVDATKYVYTTKLKKRISGFSFTSATAYPVGTITSSISI